MKFRPLAVSLALSAGACLLAGAAVAATRTAPSVGFVSGFVAAVPPGSTTSAAYLTLKNPSNTPVRLTAAKTTLSGNVMLMKTTQEAHAEHGAGGMTGMQKVSSFVIPARGRLLMKPDGNHIMLMNLRRAPKEGERVSVTVTLSTGALTISLPVRRPL